MQVDFAVVQQVLKSSWGPIQAGLDAMDVEILKLRLPQKSLPVEVVQQQEGSELSAEEKALKYLEKVKNSPVYQKLLAQERAAQAAGVPETTGRRRLPAKKRDRFWCCHNASKSKSMRPNMGSH